ncbi:helix-turn-helix domain-containing protein [uncultured Zhongshania sp.]|jgi:transcriptional regulator GlxA family with amidase domain|uniref:GlxA family transcriptional regulator n=1 Tax=uncultured Zhongshania sp. TaxID=1642288 RepID=UPI00260061FB|nr:helix-turn-helix domain-containing protein [uncultured Zhongshania sp.]
MSRRIFILAVDGAMASSLVGNRDLFMVANMIAKNTAKSAAPLFDVHFVSMDGRSVECVNGCRMDVDGSIDDIRAGDTLFSPAFMIPNPASVGDNLLHWQELIDWLREHGAGLDLIATNCSGSYALAEAGLLDGGRVTTAWWLQSEMQRRYPAIQVDRDAICVYSGNLLTGAGSSSFLDVGLSVIEKYAGKPFARLLAKYMMLDSQRITQAPYAILSLFDSSDEVVNKSEQWIRANLARDFKIEDLAANVAVSPRTLIRRFNNAIGESPQGLTQKLRIERSKILLETTQLRFSEIVQRCGYQDESAFRRLFKRYCQMTPREYRQRFVREPALNIENEVRH